MIGYKKDKTVSCLKKCQSKSNKTKPSTKLVMANREPFLYLEFSKANKQNVYVINLLKKSTFLSLKITVYTLIDVRNETSQHLFLKSVKLNT